MSPAVIFLDYCHGLYSFGLLTVAKGRSEIPNIGQSVGHISLRKKTVFFTVT